MAILPSLLRARRSWGRSLLLPPLSKEASERERTNRLNALDQLNGAFENPMNNLPGMRGTLWAALNAATEYADHHRRFRGANDQQRRENPCGLVPAMTSNRRRIRERWNWRG